MRHKSRALTAGAAVWIAACAWPQACGAQYSWQVSGAYQRYDLAEFIEVGTTGIEATYHFRPIDTERLSGPYWLAGFLDRSSSMTAGLRRERVGVYFSDTGQRAFTDSTDGYSLTGRHVWRESGWFLGGRSERRERESTGFTFKAEGYGLSAGKYVAESTAVELTLESEAARSSFNQLGVCVFCPSEIRNLTDVVSLSVLHVGRLRQMGYAVSASASDRRGRQRFRETAPSPPPFAPLEIPRVRSLIYSASGQLFPTTRLGVGVGYSHWRGDGLEDYTYDVSTVWFFRPNIAAQVGWSRARMDFGFVRRTDTASVRLLGRF